MDDFGTLAGLGVTDESVREFRVCYMSTFGLPERMRGWDLTPAGILDEIQNCDKKILHPWQRHESLLKAEYEDVERGKEEKLEGALDETVKQAVDILVEAIDWQNDFEVLKFVNFHMSGLTITPRGPGLPSCISIVRVMTWYTRKTVNNPDNSCEAETLDSGPDPFG